VINRDTIAVIESKKSNCTKQTVSLYSTKDFTVRETGISEENIDQIYPFGQHSLLYVCGTDRNYIHCFNTKTMKHAWTEKYKSRYNNIHKLETINTSHIMVLSIRAFIVFNVSTMQTALEYHGAHYSLKSLHSGSILLPDGTLCTTSEYHVA
jgi:hypothetical protein